MRARKVGALLLALLMMACASTSRLPPEATDPYEQEVVAARYELRVLSADTGGDEPVEVDKEDFLEALRMLAREVRPSEQPMETARWLMEGELQAHLVAEMERGRVVRLTPLDEGSPLAAETAAQMTRKYLNLCQQQHGGGDCLGLLTDGPTLQRKDLRTLALGPVWWMQAA